MATKLQQSTLSIVGTKYLYSPSLDCLKRRPPEYVDALWMVLDPGGRGSVSRRDFGDLAELLKMPYTDVTPRENIFEKFAPKVYRSKVREVSLV